MYLLYLLTLSFSIIHSSYQRSGLTFYLFFIRVIIDLGWHDYDQITCTRTHMVEGY
jgi:hypothetical protein